MSTMTSTWPGLPPGWTGRAGAGDPFDCLALAKALGRRVFSLAKRITQDDDAAEHVLIATFLRACSDLGNCAEHEQLWVRLAGIAVREAFQRLSPQREPRPLPDPAAPGTSEDIVIREFSVWGDGGPRTDSRAPGLGVLEEGLRSLNPMCRAVFVLRDMEEIPVEHIATILHRSVAAVEVCLLRARLQLREALAPHMKRRR